MTTNVIAVHRKDLQNLSREYEIIYETMMYVYLCID